MLVTSHAPTIPWPRYHRPSSAHCRPPRPRRGLMLACSAASAYIILSGMDFVFILKSLDTIVFRFLNLERTTMLGQHAPSSSRLPLLLSRWRWSSLQLSTSVYWMALTPLPAATLFRQPRSSVAVAHAFSSLFLRTSLGAVAPSLMYHARPLPSPALCLYFSLSKCCACARADWP